MTREEAINLIKQVLPCLNIDEKIREGFETLIPELKESEDEKIRKEIIEEIEFIIPHDDETDSEGLILPSYHARIDRYKSYLEKQKEQPITANDLDEEIHRFFDDCIDVHEVKLYGNISERVIPVDCYEITARHFAKWGEKQKEPHFTKRNALFDKCVENCDPKIMKRVSDEVDEMLEKEQKPNYCHYGGDPSVERCKYCSAICSARLTEEQKPVECSDDERIREDIVALIKFALNDGSAVSPGSYTTKEEALAYLEKQKEAGKAIEAVERIDKYIDEHLVNAHDMKDSNPDKKYYRGWDDALGKMAGILQDVYSGEKQKESLRDFIDNFPYSAEQEEQDWNKKPCLTCQEYEKGHKQGYTEGCTAGYNKAMKEMEQKEQKPSINIDQLKSLMLQYLQEAANEKDDSDIEADTDKWARKILGYDFEQKPAVEQLDGTFNSYDMAKTFVEGQYYVMEHPERFGLCKPAEWSEDWREEDVQTRFAFYTYKDEDDVLYLSNVFVEETSRNHGFGTRILRAAEKVAETIGATIIRLKVKQDSPANAWYRKNGYGYVVFEDGYDWLEKNLEYMKPNKQEWSEEDMNAINAAATIVEGKGLKDIANRLKSIRNRPKASDTWKPSEEQMKALNAINCHGGLSYVGQQSQLISLYNDLKKLM